MLKRMAALVLLAAAAPALADETKGFEFGVAVGQSGGKVDLAPGYKFDATGFGYKGFAGWRFNKWLTLEASAGKSGTLSDDIAGIHIEVDTKIYTASVIGSLPFSDSLAGYLRAGGTHWSSDEKASAGSLLLAGDESGTDFSYGIGLAGNVDRAIVRLEYEGGKLGDVDSRLISIGVEWLF